ncbi:hypothetical protein AERO9AM_10472 [Aeromicrobium sp. 9AM]|nr:hypothetical protein AERO9AM_10472 [Aeromicrobium sp. 9AM]
MAALDGSDVFGLLGFVLESVAVAWLSQAPRTSIATATATQAPPRRALFLVVIATPSHGC